MPFKHFCWHGYCALQQTKIDVVNCVYSRENDLPTAECPYPCWLAGRYTFKHVCYLAVFTIYLKTYQIKNVRAPKIRTHARIHVQNQINVCVCIFAFKYIYIALICIYSSHQKDRTMIYHYFKTIFSIYCRTRLFRQLQASQLQGRLQQQDINAICSKGTGEKRKTSGSQRFIILVSYGLSYGYNI